VGPGSLLKYFGRDYLRLPRRSRGLILGMTTLILSPVLALSLASAGQSVATTNVIAVNRTESVLLPVREPDLRGLRGHVIAAPTPTPAPSATPAPAPARPVAKLSVRLRSAAPPLIAAASPSSVIGIIEAAAARWGVSGAWMVQIARCESGLRPTAVNPAGPYLGLFQFLQSTFTHNGGTNIWDAADQANIAAKMLAHGQAYQWSCA
jgi:Transglycosylase SLT domain